MTRWGSRKFWAAMFWQAAFSALLYAGKLPPAIYEGLTWVTLGGYFIANVGDKIAKRND